jgi:hypothetical protein
VRKTIEIAVALGFILAASAALAAEGGSARHRHHRPAHADVRTQHTVQPQPEESLIPSLTPYARSGEGNNTGLSRDPDDCATGCIGGNAD